MKVKTSELSGEQLDWAVSVNEENRMRFPIYCDGKPLRFANYSTDWAQGGPIIEREKIELKYLGYDNPPNWGALKFQPSKYERKAAVGSTPLIAAMRCYVASKLGEEVEIPDNL